MNFWTGVIIGVFAGANIGIIIAGLLAASKRSDYEQILHPDRYPMEEAAIDDVVLSSFARDSAIHRHVDTAQPHSPGRVGSVTLCK